MGWGTRTFRSLGMSMRGFGFLESECQEGGGGRETWAGSANVVSVFRHPFLFIARMDRMGKGSRVSHSMGRLVIVPLSPLGIIDVSGEWGRVGFSWWRGKEAD